MKKIILAAAFFITAYTQAQVIEVYDEDVQIENNATYTYNVLNGTDEVNAAKLHLQIINVSDNTINIKLKMLEVTNNFEYKNVQFCFGPNCYFNAPPGTTAPAQASGITIAPGQDGGPSNYFYNNYIGDTSGQPVTYKLAIIQVDANGAEIGDPLITFNYVYSPTAATPDFTLSKMGIVVNNTVVKNTLDITASQNAKMDIININGQTVKKAAITSGTQSVDLSGLATAVYFARFTNEENKTAQIKIVKN